MLKHVFTTLQAQQLRLYDIVVCVQQSQPAPGAELAFARVLKFLLWVQDHAEAQDDQYPDRVQRAIVHQAGHYDGYVYQWWSLCFLAILINRAEDRPDNAGFLAIDEDALYGSSTEATPELIDTLRVFPWESRLKKAPHVHDRAIPIFLKQAQRCLCPAVPQHEDNQSEDSDTSEPNGQPTSWDLLEAAHNI